MFIQKNVNANGITLHTEYFGSKENPALIFISGAGASARFWSDEWCEAFANDFFVIRFDHRDVGLSSAIDYEKDPYKISDLAQDVVAIMDAYNIEKAHVVGHSMGGYLVQYLALQYPHRLLSETIISAGPYAATKVHEKENPFTTEQEKIFSRTWQVMMGNKPTQNFDESIDGYMKVWRYLHGDYQFDEQRARNYTKDMYERSHHKVGAHKPHIAVMQDLLDSAHERLGLLAEINIPTLIIHGTNDYLVFPDQAKEVAGAIENAHFVLIPKMGHMIFNRELEKEITERIRDFLNEK